MALVSLPVVELAEIQRHTLSRRADKIYPNVRCGDSWAAVPSPTPDKTTCKLTNLQQSGVVQSLILHTEQPFFLQIAEDTMDLLTVAQQARASMGAHKTRE